MYKWQTKIHLGKQNGNNFNWRIWYNNKYHINNSSNNKSPLPRGLQPLPRFLSHTEELLWYFLWIDLSNIQLRFDDVEEKEGTWMQTVLEVWAKNICPYISFVFKNFTPVFSHFLWKRSDRISAFCNAFLSTRCGDIFVWKQQSKHKGEWNSSQVNYEDRPKSLP